MDQECKNKVLDILSRMKPEWRWAAFDPTHQTWLVFRGEPVIEKFGGKGRVHECWSRTMFDASLFGFDLPAYPGDWKDSLVVRAQ